MPGGPSSSLEPPAADLPASAGTDASADLDASPDLDAPDLDASAPPVPATVSALNRRNRPRRPNRWDRPPEPHDWRWVIGGLGRVLITIGLLMFAFVGYQLYGTGIQTAQAQHRLENEFEQLLARTDGTDGTAGASDTSAPVATTLPPDVQDTVAVTAPTSVDPSSTSSTVPAARLTPPPQGDPLAKLTIESIGLEKIVIEGVRTSDLEDGPGHFAETPLPGQFGNSAIAGHRTTHGQPFNRIDEIQVGDDVVVETVVGRYTYVVTGQVIVSPNDYQLVIPTLDPTIATLTLTSCHPKFSAKQRIVVTAVLDPERSDVVTAPYVPPAGDAPTPSVIPGADDIPASTDVAVAATEPASDSATNPTTAGTVAGAIGDVLASGTGALTAPAKLEQTAVASQDLFENSWFSDPDAFWQVALWGIVLILVALGANAISRRARRTWVGVLVGSAPFVVVLYFWFENVNRLLPPNL